MTDPAKTTHVVYHRNCPDGYTAAWVAWRRLGDAAQYIPAQYGDPVPDLHEGAHVLIVDFSYRRDVLETLAGKVASLTLLDHHKSAAEDLRDFPGAMFDLAHSGAYLAWKYFYPLEIPPSIVNYVEDRDLWKFEYAHSREVSAYLESFDYKFGLWDHAHDQIMIAFPSVVAEGTAILRTKKRLVKKMAENHMFRHIGGYRVPIANASCYFSEVGEELCYLYPDAPFSAYYFDRSDGKRQWGLRSRGGFDVSAVAKALGGGGHAAAAGFEERQP